MNKIIKTILIFFVLSACGYEPILLNKKSDFEFLDIVFEGDDNINNIVKNHLLGKSNINSSYKYNINFISRKDKETISYNAKGDPTVYKMKITLKYEIEENNEIILSKSISKQTTYNNIKDKLELLKYEENILQNLADSISNEILVSITTLTK